MMTGYQTMDRRSSARRNTDVPLSLTRDGRDTRARAIDMSVDGALIRRRSRRAPPLVQRMRLELDTGSVATFARTIWSDGRLQAVRFVGLSDVERLDIAEHLDRLCGV